jgi:hypothetical protein
LSLFNLGFFLIFHIFSQFNLPFFHIFHIISQFNIPFFRIFQSIHFSTYFSSIFSISFYK